MNSTGQMSRLEMKKHHKINHLSFKLKETVRELEINHKVSNNGNNKVQSGNQWTRHRNNSEKNQLNQKFIILN